jgi:CrcB protein
VIISIVWVMMGGALGTLVRFLVGQWLPLSPLWGLLLVNAVGSFGMGFLYSGGNNGGELFFAIGFCGALTTFSMYSHLQMMHAMNGQWRLAILVLVVSHFTTIGGGWLGFKLK